MKKEEGWEISDSIFRFRTGILFLVVLFWIGLALSLRKSVTEIWIQMGGVHADAGTGVAFLAGVLCVFVTLAISEFFFRKLEREAESYERIVSFQRSVKKSLREELNAIALNLLMSDEELLSCTISGPLDFKVSGIWYQISSYMPSSNDIRLKLEKERMKAEAELQAFVWPEEPIKVAWWRKHIMRQKCPMTESCA